MPRPQDGNEPPPTKTMPETTDTTETLEGVGHQPLVLTGVFPSLRMGKKAPSMMLNALETYSQPKAETVTISASDAPME